jgi:hypothetical protein
VVAVVGIDAYAHWPALRNARHDALGLQQALVEKFGFEAPVAPLLDADATREAIERLVEDKLPAVLGPTDRLVLFFAGHGHTVERDVAGTKQEIGVLVPADAPYGKDERLTAYLRVDHFLQAVAELPARHVLLILDSCHSGFALGEVQRFRSGERYRIDLEARPSRRVVTSARRDQVALDGGPVPGHSLFTGTLVDALRWGKADFDGNGLLTTSEIGLYLEQRVAQATGSRQTPDFGGFLHDDRGELVLSLRGSTPDAMRARALAALDRGRWNEFDELSAKLREAAPRDAGAIYLDVRRRLHRGDVAGAIEGAQDLLETGFEAGALPVSEHDLYELVQRARYFKSVLELPKEPPARLDVDFLAGPEPERLAAVPRAALGDVQGYRIPPGSVYRLAVTNRGAEPVYIHLLAIDSVGRVTPTPFAEDVAQLGPGKRALSYPFRHEGPAGLEEIRIVVAPRLIRALDRAPTASAKGQLQPVGLDDATRAAIRVAPVYFTTAE